MNPPANLDAKAEITRGSGKRGSKPANPPRRKLPQRGLGVAKLESLRLQERWRRITEIDESQPQNYALQFPFSYFDPRNAMSVAHSGSLSYSSFNGAVQVSGDGFSGHSAGSMLPQISLEQFRIFASEERSALQSRSLIAAPETGRELSSSQKRTQCFWNFLAKKKCVNGGESAFDDCDRDFLALSLGSRKTVDLEKRNFGEKGEKRAGSFGMHADAGVVAFASQRNGKQMGVRDPVEYEFFPQRNNASKTVSLVAPQARVSEASTSASTKYIDLSLKLSYS